MSFKILLASDHYPPFIGGAQRQTQLLAQELSRRGHTVKVATVWHGGFDPVEELAGIQVHRLKQLRTWGFWVPADRKQRYQPPYPDPVTIIGLRRLIDQFQPDIIHSYGWISYSCAVALAGKDIPLLLSARDYGYFCANQTLVTGRQQVCSGPAFAKCMTCAAQHYGATKGWVAAASVWLGRGLLKRKASGLHSISTYVQQVHRRDLWGEDGHQAALVEAIIPSFREDDPLDGGDGEQSQAPALDTLSQGYVDQLPQQPFILFVGALRKVKGIQQLLNAYQQLIAPPPLVLIGTRETDSPNLFPAGVTVLHNFPHPAVMEAWQRSLFGVIPSLWPEPLGSVVYEGMSKGKAMIGTTPGGHTDMIVPGQTGLLVPADDVPALAAAMQRLIDNPQLSQQYGQAGLERSKSYTAGVVVPQFEDLYTQLVNGRKGNTSYA
jgi:glycosyltransferase involved in cell wall biosynthesis